MPPHEGQPVVPAGTPLGESHAVMIMVHGRNAAPRNILDIAPVLDRPRFTYLAPAAAGNAWYPFSFMADTERNQPGLSSGLHVLDSLVGDVLSKGIRAEHIVLLGFSQGACLAGEFAVRHARRYGGIVLYSGGLIGPPGTTWAYPGSFDDTPVLLGCSDIDAHIPADRVAESAAVFERMDAAVTTRIYPGMGHTVNADEIRHTQTIMDAILADAPG
ncbi:MAG: dienelactone hydrolase family protein [Gemmatimonadota bacterium]|jgi:predicted esterase